MADEIRVTDQTGEETHRERVVVNPDVEATLPPERIVEDPSDPRTQIEHTRERMSETIDEIEEVLVRKKENIQDRLDLMAPVRQRPLPAIGIVFGVGLLLGLITGGEDDYDRIRSRSEELDERAGTWEHRARRLLRIAREQEAELEALSGGRGRRFAESWDEGMDGEMDIGMEQGSGPGVIDHLTDSLSHGLTGLVTNAVRGMFGAGRATG